MRISDWSSDVCSSDLVSLEAYVARMPTEQNGIYYLTADTLAAARSSPHLEGFRAHNFEVLLLTDRIDEWVVNHLTEFGGKKLESVARASKDLDAKIETPEKRSEERRVGKESVRTCRSRRSQYN